MNPLEKYSKHKKNVEELKLMDVETENKQMIMYGTFMMGLIT